MYSVAQRKDTGLGDRIKMYKVALQMDADKLGSVSAISSSPTNGRGAGRQDQDVRRGRRNARGTTGWGSTVCCRRPTAGQEAVRRRRHSEGTCADSKCRRTAE